MLMEYLTVQSAGSPLILFYTRKPLIEITPTAIAMKLMGFQPQQNGPMPDRFMADLPDKASFLTALPMITMNTLGLPTIAYLHNDRVHATDFLNGKTG